MAEIVRLGGGGGEFGGDAGQEYPGLVGIRPLGHARDLYHYLSPTTDEIVRLKPAEHTEANLGRLRPLAWWVEHYPPPNKARQTIDVSRIRDELMAISHLVGPYDSGRLRGRGVHWEDGIGAVYHAGRVVYMGDAGYRPHEAPGGYIYEAGEALSGAVGEPLPEGDGQRLLDVCELLPWAQPRSAEVLAGWIVTALTGATLMWRPHLWLTGSAGSGKTTILSLIVKACLGELALFVEGETTEAGLRQTIGSDARPIVFDEAEADQRQGLARIERVLALARHNSAAGPGKVLKGGSGHQATAFGGSSSFLLASVGVALTRQADQTRWTVVELAGALKEDSPELVTLRQMAAGLDEAFRMGLMAAVLRHLDVLRHNHEALAEAIGRRLGRRLGDQIGGLMAGAQLLRSYARLTAAEAEAMATDLPVDVTSAAAIETDQERCLAALASAWARVTSAGGRRQVTRTLGQLVALALNDGMDEDITAGEAEGVLLQHGIAVKGLGPWLRELRDAEKGPRLPFDWQDWLAPYWAAYQAERARAAGQDYTPTVARVVFVAASHREIARVLHDTAWGQGWANVLKRLPGAIMYHGSVRFGAGVKQRAVVLPAFAFARDDQDG